jgi:hypothetical protein
LRLSWQAVAIASSEAIAGAMSRRSLSRALFPRLTSVTTAMS